MSIERNARLLCEAFEFDVRQAELEYPGTRPRWHWYKHWADKFHDVGLMLVRSEPDDATIDAIAKALILLHEGPSWTDEDARKFIAPSEHVDCPDGCPQCHAEGYREQARAAYRAALK